MKTDNQLLQVENGINTPSLKEKKRLEDLHSYSILDTTESEEYDSLVRLASKICDTPIAMINFIDQDRQWTKSSVGWELKEMPRELSVCHNTIQEDHYLEIPNATEDDKFKDNPYVTGDPNIRFYAGVNIKSRENSNLGSLCVIDKKPRRLTSDQKEALEILANEIEDKLELRLKNRELTNTSRFLNNSVDLLFLMDPRLYKILKTNNEVKEVLGYSGKSLKNAPFLKLRPGKEFLERLGAWDQGDKTNHFEMETTLEAASGKNLWFNVRVTEVDELWYITAVKVQKRKEIEEEFYRTHKGLESSQRIAKIGSWEWYPSTNELIASDEAYRLYEVDPAKETLTLEKCIEKVHPNDRTKIQEAIEKVLAGGTKPEYEYRIIKSDGSISYMINRSEVHRDENGNVTVVFGTAQDITDQKLAEQKILASLKEKEIMLAEIHHRVKNNLAVISGMIDLEKFSSENEESEKTLDKVSARVQTIALIHENLYQSENFSNVDFGIIFKGIIKISADHNSVIENLVTLDTDDVSLNINQAVPFAMVISNLVLILNEHKELNGVLPLVRFSLQEKNETIHLKLSADKEDFFPTLFQSLDDRDNGLTKTIINTLLEQLKADFNVSSSDGKSVEIAFQKSHKKGSSSANF